jgi:hypothetical protein
MAWREWAAAQYNHVLSIMKDTMDKTLFVIDSWEGMVIYRHQRKACTIMLRLVNIVHGYQK